MEVDVDVDVDFDFDFEFELTLRDAPAADDVIEFEIPAAVPAV